MNQILSVVGLNSIGLALATWGVTMLSGTHHPFLPTVEVILTSLGLGMIASGTGWLTFLMFVGSSRQKREPIGESIPTRSTTPSTPVPRRDKLVTAMEDLQKSALRLIERRRELHHLNVHQWHHAHAEETSMEIEANKEYRQARSHVVRSEFEGGVRLHAHLPFASLRPDTSADRAVGLSVRRIGSVAIVAITQL